MSKLTRFFPIFSLIVLAFLFGVSGGVDAKQAGGAPPGPNTVGPATVGTMTFFVDDDHPDGLEPGKISFVGTCGGLTINGESWYDWRDITKDPVLEAIHLVNYGADVNPNEPGPWELIVNVQADVSSPTEHVTTLESQLQDCYRTEFPIQLQFKNVRNFIELPDSDPENEKEKFSAEVILLRVTVPGRN